MSRLVQGNGALRPLEDCRLAVVGLGLMGGSLVGALHPHCRAIVGVDTDPAALRTALARGWIDQGTVDLAEGLRGADLVVLATPVRTILRLVREIGPLLQPGSLLMDLGSTKVAIAEAMDGMPAHVQPLGGHPMCGKEYSGIEAADPALYRGATFVLSPLARTAPDALLLGQALARAAGARPVVMEPVRHDALVATTSHLPYLLSCALVGAEEAVAAGDPLALSLLAGGFRDTSRLAGSDVTVMMDILLTNRAEILRALDGFQSQLQRLAWQVEHADETTLRQSLVDLRAARQEYLP